MKDLKADDDIAEIYMNDSFITGKVMACFRKEPNLKIQKINVKTFNGIVNLSGVLESQFDLNRSQELIKNMKGVVAINNQIIVSEKVAVKI